jgi:xylitol oxidase
MNWAGTHAIAAERIHEPRSVEELQSLVAGSSRIRALGTGHTFNDLPDGPGDLVSLASLPRRVSVDPGGTVTVDAGARYSGVVAAIDQAGFALEAMASLPHITVAGACATGTHGSGDRTRSLSGAVAGLDLVAASGELVRIDRSTPGDELAGLVVGLGAFGVVTAVLLDAVPAYRMRQDVIEDVALDAVLERFDEVTSTADSVSLFTVWQGRTFHQAWCKRRVADGDDGSAAVAASLALFGGRPADRPLHPIPAVDAGACTAQLGAIGPWHERLPHFRADRTPSSGHELQSEFLVDRRHAPAAISALFAAADRFAAPVQVSEVRTIAADRLWLGTASGRDSVALHFTWVPDRTAVLPALAAVEAVLAPFDPRPHWGKLWTLPVDAVRASYPRWGDAARLRERWDPDRVFANPYVDALLGD